MPAGPGMHEWSRTYRDLIFDMAFFIDRRGGQVTPDLVRKFIGRRPDHDIVASFSESEVDLLMRKSIEYDLPLPQTDLLHRAGSWER